MGAKHKRSSPSPSESPPESLSEFPSESPIPLNISVSPAVLIYSQPNFEGIPHVVDSSGFQNLSIIGLTLGSLKVSSGFRVTLHTPPKLPPREVQINGPYEFSSIHDPSQFYIVRVTRLTPLPESPNLQVMKTGQIWLLLLLMIILLLLFLFLFRFS